MYYDVLDGLEFTTLIASFFSALTFILIIMPLHSVVQAYTVKFLRGGTPETSDKLRWNPLVHQSLVSMAFLLLFDFGWVTSSRMRTQYFFGRKWQILICMLSGQLVHIGFALLSGLCYNILAARKDVIYMFDFDGQMSLGVGGSYSQFANMAGVYFFSLIFGNILIFFINFLPFNPFDGYYILRIFTSESFRSKARTASKVALFIIFILCVTTILRDAYRPYINYVCVLLVKITSSFVPK